VPVRKLAKLSSRTDVRDLLFNVCSLHRFLLSVEMTIREVFGQTLCIIASVLNTKNELHLGEGIFIMPLKHFQDACPPVSNTLKLIIKTGKCANSVFCSRAESLSQVIPIIVCILMSFFPDTLLTRIVRRLKVSPTYSLYIDAYPCSSASFRTQHRFHHIFSVFILVFTCLF
jgi:hypothetical protein